MSGETEQNISGWSVDTLHSHLIRMMNAQRQLMDERDIRYQQRFDASQKALEAALASQQRSITDTLTAAERDQIRRDTAVERDQARRDAANEKRFDSVNEFRKTLTDQAATFMPRGEAEAIVSTLSERMQALATSGQHWVTREEMQATIDRQTERIQELTNRMNRSEGQGLGVKENRSGIYAALGATVAIMSIIIVVVNVLT